MTKYQRAINKLYDLQKFGIKLGLNSTANLLERLGNPHHEIDCLHIAGTNGKGSVATMVEAALLAAKIKAGLYTSPHLVSFTERFRISGREISQRRTTLLIDAVWEVADPREPPTFFEFVTAMAFVYFAQEGVELAIMETGLGGRLDATNVCQPLVTVITNIGLEHTEHLGNTLSLIAYEKAGIIKRGVPLIHGVAPGVAREVIEKRAAKLRAPMCRRGRDLRFRTQPDGSLSLWGQRWSIKNLRLNLAGNHQASNAALALGACEALAETGLAITADHVSKGFALAQWPGRMERWPTKANQAALWLDGAHNIPAAKALIANLDLVREGRSPLVMVIGIMADKEVDALLSLLTPAADKVVFSRPAYMRSADPAFLAAQAAGLNTPHQVEPDFAKAIKLATKLAGKNGVVLITGSLFTVGEARALLQGKRPEIVC